MSLCTLQNINTSHCCSKNYTDLQSNKESITSSVFSHTKQWKHLQINNIVFHFRTILFLQDLVIHSFFPFYLSDHHLVKGLPLSLVHDSGIHFLLITETRLCQYSVLSLKHTFSKLRSLPRLFPISLDCLPEFWFLIFLYFMPYRLTSSETSRDANIAQVDYTFLLGLENYWINLWTIVLDLISARFVGVWG